MPAASPQPESAATARGYRPVALALLTVLLVVLCAVLAYPLLPALAWGIALAVIAWPLHARVASRTSRPRLAAALTTAVVVTVVVSAGVFVVYHLAREAASAADQMREKSAEVTLRDRLIGVPVAGQVVGWLERVGVNVDRELHAGIDAKTREAAALANGSLMAIIQFAVAVFVLYHLLLDREPLLRRVRGMMPLTRDECDRVVKSAADSVHANLNATLVTSLIDGVGGGLIFWALGLPSPVTWGVVMFFLSFLPLLGTWVVWIPAAGYLGLNGQWGNAAILIAWGVASSFVVDNVIYVRVAGDRMRLHQVPALIAFLGGLAVFGAAGMVLGPAILAVTVAILDVWHRRAAGDAAGSNDPPATYSENGLGPCRAVGLPT